MGRVEDENRADEGIVVWTFERSYAGDDFVKHHRKRPDVGAMIDVTASTRLFGRHVVRASEDDAGLRGFTRNIVVMQFGNAKVDDLGDDSTTIVCDETNVVRLQIAMDDAFAVRC